MKRLFDVFVSVITVMALLPIFIIVSFFIKITSPGKVLYRGVRAGKNEVNFEIYKFRTMVVNADEKLQKLLSSDIKFKNEYEESFKLKHDPRVIQGIGVFLRRTSLDEIPQFYNVLVGDMSVVGPRPIVYDEIQKYKKSFSKLISIRPGLTGFWQVNGRSDIDYRDRVAMDMEYIDNSNIWLDIKIIFKTIKMMMTKNNGSY